MGEHKDKWPTNRGIAHSYRRMLGAGVAVVLGGVLLWNLRGDLSPSQQTVMDRARVTNRIESVVGAETSFAESAISEPIEESLPAGGPAGIAGIVARFLSRVPDLDPQHLRAMFDRALDPDQPLADRVAAIRWLARFGTDEAIEVLERLLRLDSPPSIRSSVAMALGDSSHLNALHILTSLLDDNDPNVVLAAIRGLANQRDPGATAILISLVADASLRDEVRSEAATALGSHEEAAGFLRDAFARSDGDLASGALAGLARQPFHDGESVFRELLQDPEVSLGRKVEAVEALGEGSEGAAEFLLEVARSSDDIELRSAAIDTLALSDEPGDTISEFSALVRSEPSADVRADLYNALAFNANQANGNGSAELVGSVLAEQMPRAKLEGYRMVASMLHDQYELDTAQQFDSTMVDWLRGSAEQGADRYMRHLAIDALKLAGTPGANEALLDLSHSTDPLVSHLAEKALHFNTEGRSIYVE